MYKMAVLDVDGTISKGQNKISERTIETIHKTIKKGVPVCICTGRNHASALPIMQILDTNMPFGTIDGLIIYKSLQKEILYEDKIKNEIMTEIAEMLQKEKIYIEAVTPEKYYRYAINAKEYDYGLSQLMNYTKYTESYEQFMETIPGAYMFITGGEQSTLLSLKNNIQKKFGKSIGIIDSAWQNYMFITPPVYGKSKGVENLCRHYNIKPSEVVAIGDDLNDICMLKAAGMGVAMGNGKDRAKEAADYITDTVENDGAALALEKFFDL